MSKENESTFELSSFKNSDAEKYGILEAIILWHIRRYLRWAKNNRKNLYEGRFWTYNSIRAWQIEIPFCTTRQIEYSIENLKKAKIVLTGNFNKHKYDRTVWYSINDDAYISQNCEMEKTNLLNGNNKNVEPIPNLSPKTLTEVVEESTATTSCTLNSLKEFKEYFSNTPYYSRLKAPGAIVLCHAYYQLLERLSDTYTDLCAKFTKRKPYKESFTEDQQEAWQKDLHSFIENAILKEIKK